MIFLWIIICIIASAFFSGLETGLLSANQLSLYSLAEKKVFYARVANFLLLKPERLLSTTLIGNNITIVAATVLLKVFFEGLELPEWCTWLGSLSLSIILLIFSEIFPKSFFRKHADTLSVRLAPALLMFYYLFFLLSLLMNAIVSVLLFLFRQKKQNRGPQSRQDLKLLIKLVSKEAAVPAAGQNIFDDIFDFKNTMAREVMIPFHEIPVCSIDSSLESVIQLFTKTRCSFIIIFAERADNIVGYINLRDLVYHQAASLQEVMKTPLFFPDTKRIPELLMNMNRKKLDAVFLSDEYGGVCGMISPSAIAAEIIGYAPGHHRREGKREIDVLAHNHYLVSGTMDIDDFFNQTGLAIERGSYDTIGGYLCDKLGIIPEPGVIFEQKGVLFKVVDRDVRHIKKVEIVRVKKDEIETKIGK